jgi:hypothetical protein
VQDNTSLKGLQDIVVAPGFGVVQDFGHKLDGNPSRPAARGGVNVRAVSW